MERAVIKVENLTKQYQLGMIGTGNLYNDVKRWWALARGKEDPFKRIGEINDRATVGNSDFVMALNDINFEVKKGEVAGLIGKNGSGKSTLLKLLAKVTAPSEGVIKLKGRVASMLEVGTGFHPELTGRENIFLNGTIMGMTKKEVKQKFDEIVEFAGVARYVETPIKRYSSGMTVRLAFAVAAHLNPEILLVDEVLAVGDAEFQNKCIGKMSEVSKQGRTIIFVSHNLGSIKRLCNTGIVLHNGQMIYRGGVDAALDKYLESLPTSNSEGDNAIVFETIGEKLYQFKEVSVENGYREQKGTYQYGEKVVVNLKYLIREEIRNCSVKMALSRNGEPVFWSFDTDENPELFKKRTPGEYSAKIQLPPYLKAGVYTISVSFLDMGDEKEEHTDVIRFVLDDSNVDTMTKSYHMDFPGMLKPQLDWVYFEHPVVAV